MQTIRITTSQNIAIDYEVASVGERILAYIIDLAILFALYLLLILGALMLRLSIAFDILQLIAGIIFAFYDLGFEFFMNGQSIGKRAMKMRVISLNGSRPTISQFAIRWVMRLIDLPATAYLAALISIIVSEKNQRLGDLAAGTVVVKTNPRIAASALAFQPSRSDHVILFPQAKQLSDSDIKLIHEVLNNVQKNSNFPLLHQLARQLQQHLAITLPEGLSDHDFLTALINDYNAAAGTDV